MGLLHARRGHDPGLQPAARHAGLGAGLCAGARARPPAGARARAGLLGAGRPLPADRAGPRLPRGHRGGCAPGPLRRGRGAARRGRSRRGGRVTRRAAVLLLSGPPASRACPPGVAPDAFARALAEDVADLLADLPGLDALVAAAPDRVADAEDVVWPGTPVLETGLGTPMDVFAALATRGYDEAAVVVADAPDLPGLLVAKPFSALATARVAAAPARGGGLVALATRLPAPQWLPADVDLDEPYAVERLRAAAPEPADLALTTPWRRLRSREDLAALDPELEGWEA